MTGAAGPGRSGPGASGPERVAPPGGGRPAARAAAVAVLAALALCHPAGVADRAAAGSGTSSAAGADADRLVRLERGWPVMGTLLRVSAAAPDSAAARRALRTARARVFRVDSLMSTYRSDSDLSRIADAAGSGRWVEVSASTARVLEAARAWARASGGAFDPTAGPLADAWGFHGEDPGMPAPRRADSAARLVGWRQVEYDPAGPRIRLPRAGMRLDFGGIAKGWALDRAVEAMREAGAVGGTVDLGGNVSAFGRPPPRHDRWRLGVAHPRRDDRLAGVLAVDSGSVATSGDSEQFFVHRGKRYAHVMDPRTGRPARGVMQVTVIADRAVDADALATALFVLGPEEGRFLLASATARRRAPRATAVWLLDPGADTGPGREEIVCAGPRAPDVELWPEPEEAAGPAAGPDTLPGGCRVAPPAGRE